MVEHQSQSGRSRVGVGGIVVVSGAGAGAGAVKELHVFVAGKARPGDGRATCRRRPRHCTPPRRRDDLFFAGVFDDSFRPAISLRSRANNR